jgi:hypothetical protein
MENKLPAPIIALAMVLATSACLAASSQAFAEELEMIKMVDDLSVLGEVRGFQAEGQVLNASPAQREHWPATFVFLTREGSCTATAVGRRVVITAAHCIRNGQRATVVAGDKNTTLTCHHHPKYPRDISADFALCLVDSPLPGPDGGFERVNNDASLIRQGGQLMLLGYGCTTNRGQRDFGRLYQGLATIADPPLEPSYILTVGGAAVCYGDSGGGAYWVASPQAIAGSRLFVAVNSRGDINTYSWLSNTATSAFMDWARGWASGLGVAICGVYGSEDHCRQR